MQLQEKQESIDGKQKRMEGLKTAIENFLQNFAFEKIYDYRAALDELRDKITAYAKYSDARQTYDEKVKEFAYVADEPSLSAHEIDQTQARFSALQLQREEVENDLGRNVAHLEETERQLLNLQDVLSEEPRLNEEKARLEKRLTAIVTARTFLIRARENMAKRYLQPVEKYLAEYQEIVGLNEGCSIRLSGDGQPVLEDNGVLRAVQYYSQGTNDLLFFCLRLALSKALPIGELPPLILDDPFINLDDDKTARAKRLVKALGKERQILYFTCKSERAL